MLKYFYITNNPSVAAIAQSAGVDRIFVDMEYIGKDARQPDMDTVKNHHTVEDVAAVRKVLNKSQLLVRINPIHDDTEQEIEAVINAGADIIMLPMWKSAEDVKRFISAVDSRVKTILLLENKEASACLGDVLMLEGVDEIHIGLNDLHLSLEKKFLFELLTDGTVDALAEKIKAKGIPFGIGGFARVFQGDLLPAENIMAEHYRLGSSMAILSRAFCDTSKTEDLKEIESIFCNGISDNREYEKFLSNQNKEFFDDKHRQTAEIIQQIVSKR